MGRGLARRWNAAWFEVSIDLVGVNMVGLKQCN
jgi:hypothetical protein